MCRGFYFSYHQRISYRILISIAIIFASQRLTNLNISSSEDSRDGRKLRRAIQGSDESFPRPYPLLRCAGNPRRKLCATCALETCLRPIASLRTCAGHPRRATRRVFASGRSTGVLNHVTWLSTTQLNHVVKVRQIS